jgi:dephospho-CoA kinase
VNSIGLTGGIGSGKSTVAARFANLGASVIDTDEISRGLTGAQGAVIDALRAEFGAAFFAADGALDRAAMRDLVFEDARARSKLEAILHPAIRAATDSALAEARGPYAILVVPLLFETRGYLERLARTLTVDCAEDLQVARTMARSGLTREGVARIMAAQWPRWRRLQAADDVVWNGGAQEGLGPQCDRLHRAYCALAKENRW